LPQKDPARHLGRCAVPAVLVDPDPQEPGGGGRLHAGCEAHVPCGWGRGVFTLRALRSTGRNELLSKRGRSQT